MPQRLMDELGRRGFRRDQLDLLRRHHQRLGGALDTAILELSLLSEADLLEAVASAYGLPTCTPSDASKPQDPSATRAFPEQWAKRHSLAPMELDTKRQRLTLLSTIPPSLSQLTRLGEMLELTLSPILAPELRVHQRLSLLYAQPPPARIAALLDRAGGGLGIDSIRPPRPGSDILAAEPMTFAETIQRLRAARGRDEIVHIALSHVRRDFDFAALFSVHPDHVSGFSAQGSGSEYVHHIRIGAGARSALWTSLETEAHFLGPLSNEDVEAFRPLRRPTPRAALVVPLKVRDRIVALLYAENGPRAIAPRLAANLMVFGTHVQQALETALLKSKQEGESTAPLPRGASTLFQPIDPTTSDRPARTNGELSRPPIPAAPLGELSVRPPTNGGLWPVPASKPPTSPSLEPEAPPDDEPGLAELLEPEPMEARLVSDPPPEDLPAPVRPAPPPGWSEPKAPTDEMESAFADVARAIRAPAEDPPAASPPPSQPTPPHTSTDLTEDMPDQAVGARLVSEPPEGEEDDWSTVAIAEAQLEPSFIEDAGPVLFADQPFTVASDSTELAPDAEATELDHALPPEERAALAAEAPPPESTREEIKTPSRPGPPSAPPVLRAMSPSAEIRAQVTDPPPRPRISADVPPESWPNPVPVQSRPGNDEVDTLTDGRSAPPPAAAFVKKERTLEIIAPSFTGSESTLEDLRSPPARGSEPPDLILARDAMHLDSAPVNPSMLISEPPRPDAPLRTSDVDTFPGIPVPLARRMLERQPITAEEADGGDLATAIASETPSDVRAIRRRDRTHRLPPSRLRPSVPREEPRPVLVGEPTGIPAELSRDAWLKVSAELAASESRRTTGEEPAETASQRPVRTVSDLLDDLESTDRVIREAAHAELVARGAGVLPDVMDRFPGRLDFDPFANRSERLPPFSRCGPLLAALLDFGPQAHPYVCQFLDADRAIYRFYALYYYSAIRIPDAIPLLVRRLHDEEARICLQAVETLSTYRDSPEFDTVLQHLHGRLDSISLEARRHAIRMLTLFRDTSLIPTLIDLIERKERRMIDTAEEALVELTKQSFGSNTRRWREWWTTHQSLPRARWLIEGLSSDDESVRRSASIELTAITGQHLGFDETAPKRKREEAAKRWEEYLNSQGL